MPLIAWTWLWKILRFFFPYYPHFVYVFFTTQTNTISSSNCAFVKILAVITLSTTFSVAVSAETARRQQKKLYYTYVPVKSRLAVEMHSLTIFMSFSSLYLFLFLFCLFCFVFFAVVSAHFVQCSWQHNNRKSIFKMMANNGVELSSREWWTKVETRRQQQQLHSTFTRILQ